jgi:hypothetical protein
MYEVKKLLQQLMNKTNFYKMKKIILFLTANTLGTIVCLNAQDIDSLKPKNKNEIQLIENQNFTNEINNKINKNNFLHTQVIKFKDFAQVFIVLKDNKNQEISFYNMKDEFVNKVTSNGSYLIVNLPNGHEYKCIDNTLKTDLGIISTTVFNKGEVFEVSSEFFKTINSDEELRAGTKNLITALDQNKKIDYFEKLAFVQAHVLYGASLPSKMIIDSKIINDDFLSKSIEPVLRKKNRGDDPVFPWDFVLDIDHAEHLNPWWNPGGNLKPDCRATYILKSKDEVSFGFSGMAPKITLPYDHWIYPNPIKSEVVAAQSGTQSIGAFWGGDNYERNNISDFKGASVSRWVMNHGWSNWGNPGVQTAGVGDSGIHYQQIGISITATSGFYFRKECGCQKPVNVKMFYESNTLVSANYLGGLVNKEARAQAQDYAVGAIVDIHTGKIEILGGNIVESQIACEVALNGEWITSLTDFAKGVVKVAGTVAGTAGGAGPVITKILGADGISDVTTGLIGMLTKPKHTFNGTCGSRSNTEVLINTSKDIYLEPNMAVVLLITSGQKLEVYGKKHWQSDASINSRCFIGSFIYNNGNVFGTFDQGNACCSKDAGVYLQTGLNSASEANNLYRLDNYYYLMGNNWESQYTSGGNPITLGNFGRIFGTMPEGCSSINVAGRMKNVTNNLELTIILEKGINIANIPIEFNKGIWQIFDIAGKEIAKGNIMNNTLKLNNINYPIGNIFVLKISNSTNTQTQKFINNAN